MSVIKKGLVTFKHHLKDTTLQFKNGLFELIRDRRRYKEIRRTLRKEKIPEWQLPLSDALHIYNYRRNRTNFALFTVPVMVLFGVPIVGYLALPAILLYPKKVLARPFLTTVMRKEFDLEKHQLRKTGFKPSLIALCEALEEEATADNDGKLRTICSAANKKIDPCDVVEETLPLFESDRLSFNYLDRYELIDLATCCGIRKSHLLPSFVLVYWIDKRVQALQSLAHALQKDIVPLTTLNKAIRHDVEAALFELLHDRTDDRDNLEVSASRMHHFWNIMKNCDKLPNASKRYAFLHGLIYLAAKQNES